MALLKAKSAAKQPPNGSAANGSDRESNPVQRRLGGFSTRIALAFVLVAMFTGMLATVLSLVSWNREFDRYIRDNLQGVADAVATVGASAYQTYGGWNFVSVSVFPQLGVRNDVAVQVLDAAGHIVYDQASMREHAQQMLEGSGSTTVDGQIRMTPTPAGDVITSPIIVGEQQVGSVRVWAYASASLLTNRDLQLRASSIEALSVAALIAMLVSAIVGAAFSRQLVKPIKRITAAARSLRGGDRTARTGMVGDDEISQLGMTFDSMASAIEAERQLERQLTSDVAHELRTPLMAIQATVEAMEDGVLPADAEHLGRVQNETRRLARLTNAILELSRLEAGSTSIDLRPLDAAHPVRLALDTHGALLEACELKLQVDLTEGLTIAGDSDRLQQAVGNLLSNAARYTPEGGTVTVTVRPYEAPAETPQGKFVAIEVSDTGIGISQEDRDKMFRRFWRADDARHRESGGLGVGLSIAKEIIDRHNGFIEVDSEPGQGSTFRIVIPLS